MLLSAAKRNIMFQWPAFAYWRKDRSALLYVIKAG